MNDAFAHRRRRLPGGAIAAAAALAAALGGCGGGSGAGERERMVERCVRSAARSPVTPEQARSMCECTADAMIAEGVGTMDMLTGTRARDIARECAISAGVPVAE